MRLAICIGALLVLSGLLALSLVILTSCHLSSSTGLCTISAQGGATLNTKQDCIMSDEARQVADLAHVLSLQALAESGALGVSYDEAVRQARTDGHPLVCLVPVPEACCIGLSCAKPYNADATVAARKAGCASSFHAWASVSWPPVCDATWPDEPHCVTDLSLVENTDWPERLRHEIFNMVVLRWTAVYAPDYRHRVYTEIEPVVAQRFADGVRKWTTHDNR